MFYGLGFVLLIRRADCQKHEVHIFFFKIKHQQFNACTAVGYSYTSRSPRQINPRKENTETGNFQVQSVFTKHYKHYHTHSALQSVEIFTLHVSRKVRIRGRVHEAQSILSVCFVFLNSFCFIFRSRKYYSE